MLNSVMNIAIGLAVVGIFGHVLAVFIVGLVFQFAFPSLHTRWKQSHPILQNYKRWFVNGDYVETTETAAERAFAVSAKFALKSPLMLTFVSGLVAFGAFLLGQSGLFA